MKKLLAVVLALCIVLLMAGCGKNDEGDISSSPSSSQSKTPTPPANDTAGVTPTGKSVSALPDVTPEHFILTTKANIWRSEITLKKDGSFSGKYTEETSEYSAEDGYPNGMVLICEFEGKFSNFIKVDEYTYAMKLSELTTKYDPDEFWIEDGILYSTAHPAGIEGGEWFYIYLPGKPTAGLDEAFTMWYINSDTLPSVLDVYGLYNPNERYAFFG